MKASDISAFMTIILLGLNLFAALLLETQMTKFYGWEILFICVLGMFTFAVLFGLWIDEPWAYPLSSILFALSLVNVVWLFHLTNTFLTAAFAFLVNIAGLVLCLASIQKTMPTAPLETYDVQKRKKK
ncbi:MAG: hypothetical protein QW165_02955 [Candidatus Woesearchaeota archaeon]